MVILWPKSHGRCRIRLQLQQGWKISRRAVV
jgi:hypothetical protein